MMCEQEQLVIERDHNRVLLILNLADEYAAIATYDTLIEQAREGFMLLDVVTLPKGRSERHDETTV